MRFSTLLWLLGIGATASLGGALAHRFLPASPVVRGLYIGERRLPDRGPAAAEWLAARRDAARAWKVRFYAEATLFEATLGEAGVEIDVDQTLDNASRIGHRGDLSHQIRAAEAARDGRIDVPLVWTVDDARASALLASYAPALRRPPTSARLDLDRHQKIPDVPGRELNLEASLAVLHAATHDDDEALPLVLSRVPAKITVNDLSQVDITRVVAAYETSFSLSGSGAGRAINIRHAASFFDGMVLAPGALFSFNEVVGPRTRERGFAMAPEIQGDELLDGYGGGTCQVSSTLHAAALFGALEIVERQAHSRVSSYTALGLDAAVSYPLTDLKLRNTLPFPVMVHAYLPRPTAIRVELLGGDPIARVAYAYDVQNPEDFVRRVTVKPELRPGKRTRHQKGARGFDVTSLVKVQYLDGREDERRYSSAYRPSPEVYWVAPGVDPAELPPLPEHARAVIAPPPPPGRDTDELGAGDRGAASP